MNDEPTVTVRDFRAHLADYLARVRDGQSLTVTAHGQPIARLVPPSPTAAAPRTFGFMKGEIWIADDFDAMPQDVIDSIEADLPTPERRDQLE